MKINRSFHKKVALAFALVWIAATVVAFCAEDATEVADGYPLLYSRDGANLERIWRELEEEGSSQTPYADAVDFQLRRQGARYRGKLLRVSGRLLRAARRSAPDGREYYELWALLSDSERDPIRILARRAPQGFQCDAKLENATPYPRDVEYRRETITTRAIYYRSTAYDAGDDLYTAPTLVALDFTVEGGSDTSANDSKATPPPIWRELLKPKPARVLGLVLIWLAVRNFLRRRRARRLASRGSCDRFPPIVLLCALASVCNVASSSEPVGDEFWASLVGGAVAEWRAETESHEVRPRLDAEEVASSQRRAFALRALDRFSSAVTTSVLAEREPSLRACTLVDYVATGGVADRSTGAAHYFLGLVQSIESVALTDEERSRSGVASVYRLELATSEGDTLAVYSSALPSFRAPDGFFDSVVRSEESDTLGVGECVGGIGLDFGLEESSGGGACRCALAAKLGWYPEDAPLARLGVDLNAFASVPVYAPTALDAAQDVASKRAIARALRWTSEERSAFYQSLSATRRSSSFGGRGTDVVSLFNRPERNQGSRVSLRGWARRVNLVVITDADARAETGLERYYQLYVFTNESQGRPITVCVADLPDSLTPGGGREYRREVEISGFFYKTWAYRDGDARADVDSEFDSRGHKGAWTSSPVVIGRITRVEPEEPPSRAPISPSAVFTSFFALACAWILLRRLASRRALSRARRSADAKKV